MSAVPGSSAAQDWPQIGAERERELLARLGRTEALPGDAQRVLGASDFVFESCMSEPVLLQTLLDDGALSGAETEAGLRALTEAAVANADDEAQLMQCLRLLRRSQSVRLAWRDIGGLGNYDSVVAETTWLADAIIDIALDRLYGWACAQRGSPCDAAGVPQRLVVLALGKLGAGELNFSSDIDLIFTFPATGETQGSRRSISNDEFFVRLGRRLIHVLDTVDHHGFVYRVDMRLRPFGTGGPLVTSFGAVEHYYQTHGRDWERYALIRARVVAGDRDAGAALLATLKPFVFRRYLDFSALESIREMKLLINAEVQRAGLALNVKLGQGGIREVEFLAQAFQLVRGGRMPSLRSRQVLVVLERLAEHTLLPAFAAHELADAYRFLRTVEHRLQQVADQQTHLLPEAADARARLAYACGYPDWPALDTELNRHRSDVRAHFDQIFGAAAPDTEEPEDPLTALAQRDVDAEEGVELLSAAGFGELAAQAYEQVAGLLKDARLRRLSERAHHRFVRLLPQVLRAATRTPDPLTTLARICAVLQTIAQRAVYLALLVERPLALSQLVRLCSGSALIAHHICQYPLVIDELLDSRTLYAPLRKAALAVELKQHLSAVESGDLEQEMETLRREKQTNVLRVAAADLMKAMPLMVVSDHLTEIAEVCVEQALALSWRDVTARHGQPRYSVDGERRTAGFAVIAYGKLGGLELSYGSDLDLVYVHGSVGEAQTTDGKRELDNAVFFARLAQRLVHVISARTAAGVLYEVDLRLRPDGDSGVIVSPIEGFAEYQRSQAWTWEHQALVRARFICGDPALGARFAEVRREILLRPRAGEGLCAEVRDMRARMRSELGTRDMAVFDLKQDEGGIADIEFMVQYLVLRHARQLGAYLEYTDNIRLLDGIEAGGILPATQTRTLADAYRAYRARGHVLALQELPARVAADEFTDLRRAVGAIWSELMVED